ncbi:MAG: hypothetical protein MI922_23020 [Bacteroidales bacterium]|nr:hypothetical protein [Bacteroidales bacterium]
MKIWVCKIWIPIILIGATTFQIHCQIKPIGLPIVTNYDKRDYNAETQNWEIIEDKNGFVYAANNQGVLQFNGSDWNLYRVANRSIVRSLALGDNNTIYVGAYNEIGKIVRNANGEYNYETLMHLVPGAKLDFDDVWRTYFTRYGVVFQSFEYVFVFNNGSLLVFDPVERFGFSYYVNNNYYVVDKGIGLKEFHEGGFKVISKDSIFQKYEVRFILPSKSNELLIGTLSGGIYILKNGIVTKWECKANKVMLEQNIFSGIKIKNTYTIGTIKDGLYFVNEDGEIIQHINRNTGLQNNTVLSLFNDSNNNLWLGLDNGIDFIKSSLPVSIMNFNYNLETSYTSAIHNDLLYVGTNQGLFVKPINELDKISNQQFQLVKGTEGQVWNLTVFDNTLFCAHNKGTYIIEGISSKLIYDKRGVWNFLKPSSHPQLVFSGTYDGIIKYKKDDNGQWRYIGKIQGLDVSVRNLNEDRNGNFWFSHGYQGVYKVNFNQLLDTVLVKELYDHRHGLPGELPYFAHVINDKLLFTTNDGIYQYNVIRNNFLRPKNLNDFYQGIGLIYKLYQDYQGNIWYFTQDKMGLFKLLEDGNYVKIEAPFKQFQNSLMSSFSNIYSYDSENVFIGTQDGLVHYNASIPKNYQYDIQPFITSVTISSNKKDSICYGQGSQCPQSEFGAEKTIPYQWNSVRFQFTSNDLENVGTEMFRYRLVGYNDLWSDWTNHHDKEFTKLKGGQYRFEIQTKNIYGNQSNVKSYRFNVAPHFLNSRIAYIIYVLIAFLLAFVTYVLIRRRIEKIRNFEKKKHEMRLQQKTEKLKQDNLIAEKELEKLRNERLLASVKHKNKELANSTYYIIQKNKFLNKLKDELSNLSKRAKSELVEEELKKISRKIDKDIHHEQNWRVFNKYFDEVHQDFFVRLKETYPELTPKELRLCGFLRMNISTKEIAPLLNISYRGVEISRYRLRKKLNLSREDNLIDFLMNL